MHCQPAPAKRQSHAQEIAHLLDLCYHIDPSKFSNSPGTSTCPCALAAAQHTTWRDATGKHDPDFRPFVSGLSRPSFPTTPRRSSFDAPLSPAMAPSKAERAAARSELHPALADALMAHERQLARERRPAWLKRHRKNSDAVDYVQEVHLGLDDASPPLSLPELVTDYGSDDEELEDEDADEKSTAHPHPHREQIKQQLASLTLRVDLAVFRAKKRLRRRVGLE